MAELISLWTTLSFVVLMYSQFCMAGHGRYITDEVYIYRLRYPNKTVCMTASLNAKFVIAYETYNTTGNETRVIIESKELVLPNSTITSMSGDCNTMYSDRTMTLSWYEDDNSDEFSVTFNFAINATRWYLSQVRFDFYLDNTTFGLPEGSGYQSYITSSGVKFFNRTFNRQQYFYCKSCKTFWLLEGNDSSPCYLNDTVCSYLTISNSVIYPGDLDSNTTIVSRRLCIEDYIELQEIIVPAVVGGILGILLIVIFGSYLIAFIRRKQKEGRYETIGNGGF